MSTWNGWAADFLSAVGAPNTANNRRFLNSWASNAQHPNLTNNPNDLHLKEPGSTNGPAGPGTGEHFQNYHTAQKVGAHTWARTAFDGQITSGDYPHLRAALRSGNPYNASNIYDVEGDLNKWGSYDFGAVYVADAQAGPPVTLKAPQALRGWSDMQRSVNRHMPSALNTSQRARKRALRNLARIRKVRL